MRRRFCLLGLVGALMATAPATLQLGGAAHASSTLDAAAGQFIPISPVTVVNSSATPSVGWSGKIQPGATQTVDVTAALGLSNPSAVQAVFVQVTTRDGVRTGTTNNGNLWVWPSDQARPTYALIANSATGAAAENSAIVQVSSSGQLSFFNGTGSTAVNVNVSLQGYVTSSTATAAGAPFEPLTPKRVIYTANGIGGRTTPLTPTSPMTFNMMTGTVDGIPSSGVAAIALNVGGQGSNTNCTVTAQPTGASGGAYPSVDVYATASSQDLAIVSPNAAGNVTFTTTCPSANIFVDVEGYYLSSTAPGSGDYYVPILNPLRIVDTRSNLGITGALTPGREIDGISVTGSAAVPASGVDAVALSIGTMNGTANSWDTIWATGAPRPSDTSTIDVDPSMPESNLVFIQAGSPGAIDVYSAGGGISATHDLLVNVEGYFAKPSAPSAPQNVVYNRDSTDAYLSWNPPVSDGGARLSYYTVAVTPADVPPITTTDADVTTADISGLQSGVQYAFTVSASNAIGPGQPASATQDPQPKSGVPADAGSDDDQVIADAQDDVSAAADAVQAAVDALGPDTGFAGIVDSPESRQVTVYWKGPVPESVATAIGTASSSVASVTSAPASFSESELLAAADELNENATAATWGLTAVDVPADGSGLVVEADTTHTAADWASLTTLSSQSASGVASVSASADAVDFAGRWNDTQPYWGGDAIVNVRTKAACSLGFGVHKTANPNQTGGLTARHCQEGLPEPHYDAFETPKGHGVGVTEAVDTGKDALFMTGGKYNTKFGSSIWTGGVDQTGGGSGETYANVVRSGVFHVGDRVCTSGAFSGQRCRIKITFLHHREPDGVSDLAVGVQLDHAAAAGNGDSGGPVYRRVTGSSVNIVAVGLVDGGDLNTQVPCTGVPSDASRVCSWRIYMVKLAPELALFHVAVNTHS